MFPQGIPPDSYWNYMMLPSLMNGAAMIPRPTTQADQLKAFLSLAKPSPSGSPIAPKRTVHAVLKPPLYVSREWKQIGPGTFVKEVTDPSVPENDELRTYMMCGECDSKKLYRRIPSILKHRQFSHCGGSILDEEETQPIGSGYPDHELENIDQLVLAARTTLESLSPDELRTELSKVHVPLGTGHLSKRQLIDKYISRIVGADVFEFPQTSVCEVSEYDADQPPLPEPDDLNAWRSLKEKAETILKRFPAISRGLLTAALVADLVPLEETMTCAQIASVGIQTKSPVSPRRERPKKPSPEDAVKDKAKAKPTANGDTKVKEKPKGTSSKDECKEPQSKQNKKRKSEVTEKSKDQKDKSSSKRAKADEEEESERRSSRLALHNKKK